MWVLNQGHKGKLDPCSHKYKFIGLMDKTHASWYYKPENGEVGKLCNVIFLHSCPTTYILVPSLPEGESGSIDDEQASQETGESPDDDQETHDIEAELMPEDQATDSINSMQHSIPDITPSRSDAPSNEQFSGIQTHAQLKKSNSQLVQIRSDHGPVQMKKQKALH